MSNALKIDLPDDREVSVCMFDAIDGAPAFGLRFRSGNDVTRIGLTPEAAEALRRILEQMMPNLCAKPAPVYFMEYAKVSGEWSRVS